MKQSKVIRKYLSVDDIQCEYLPISKKRIRLLLKKHLPLTIIGKRIFVEREALETLLRSSDNIII